MKRGLATACALVGVSLAASGCGSGSDGAKAGGAVVQMRLTDAGCDPARLEVRAGPTTFEVRNDGADAVTELEVLEDGRILGEAENLAAGLSGRFSLTLRPGRYVTYCPGGDSAERGTLTVTGTGGRAPSQGALAAVSRYRRYVETQTGVLVRRTAAFAAAVRGGDLARAKLLYASARIPYERIEPVAESFGDLDPAIDARAGDVPEARWTGFHPLEQALWVRNSTKGTSRLAARLVADVRALQRRARTVELEPAQVANGSVELLGEVSKSKITGEEERYSHVDLVDFEANVDGARAAFAAVRPLVAAPRPQLARLIDRQFAAVASALAPYRRGATFVSYTELDRADTRRLSRAIDALAEPLSQVGAIVVRSS